MKSPASSVTHTPPESLRRNRGTTPLTETLTTLVQEEAFPNVGWYHDEGVNRRVGVEARRRDCLLNLSVREENRFRAGQFSLIETTYTLFPREKLNPRNRERLKVIRDRWKKTMEKKNEGHWSKKKKRRTKDRGRREIDAKFFFCAWWMKTSIFFLNNFTKKKSRSKT